MSQFLDPQINSQQLVAARFNAQHAANLVATTSHFADQLGVADPSQFVTVVQQQHQQQQQNTTTQQQLHNVANNFNFFQQHQNLSVMGTPTTSSAPNMGTTNQHQAHSQPHMDQLNSHQVDQATGNQHHLDHQQLACVNVMNADNLTNHLASASPFIFDQTNGVFRIPHTSVLDASNAIVVNTITSGLRQQHQLQQHQNHQQQQGNNLSGMVGDHHQSINNSGNNSNHRGHSARGNRSDENGHKRPVAGSAGQASAVNNNNVNSRSPTKSNNATNQTQKSNDSSSKTKCSKTKGANKKIQKPEKVPDPNRRTFSCPTCGKGFTENFNMKRHMQIHSQTRPKFACNECSKSFAWKDNFVRHKKAAHNDNILEPFAL